MAPKEEPAKKKKAEGSKDKDSSSKKEKKEKDPLKEKDKKDKKEKDPTKEKKEKDPSKEKKKDTKKDSSCKEAKPAKATAAPPKPEPRAPPKLREAPPPPKGAKAANYLGDVDLPSSSESEDDQERYRPNYEAEDKPAVRSSQGGEPGALRRCIVGLACHKCPKNPRGTVTKRRGQVTVKDSRKLADKERKILEKAAQMRADALRDDDSVFDVAFERQGDGGDVLSATDIKVHNLTIRAKGKVLLENTQLSITAGRRYGLVGPNGMGKSTLLRMVARRQVPVPAALDVLLVEQEVVGDERSALQAVVAADAELMALRAEEAELTARLGDASLGSELSALAGQGQAQLAQAAATLDRSDGGDGRAVAGETAPPAANGHATGGPGEDDAAADRLNVIYERMAEIGAASAEARASKILHGLGFSEVMQRRATQLFSGGWRMRISLARALYIQPTVLLLDEPTNHLDLRAVLWLEEYLTRWKKTLVVVSHDRDFLNTVTTDIIHLHDQRLHYYRGNFAQFEEMYEQKRKEVNKQAEKFEKQLKAAKRSGSKATQDKVTKTAKQAVARRARGATTYDDEAPAADAPRRWHDYTVRFEFPPPTELSTTQLLQLLDVGFAYPGREDFGLAGLNIGVGMGSRVAIVGPNGAGKTTLMNLIAGDLDPTVGEARRSHTLRIGRYAQHFVDALQMDEHPVEYLLNKYPQAGLKPEQMRQQLGRFGLSGHHHLQPIAKLSGGQKARVVFTSISLANPHILLLDEPTNHLDMQSIDALSDALEEFEGGVVVISHDSQLLSRVCDDAEQAEVWLVEDGTVARYNGYFEDYKEELMKEISAEMEDD